MKYLGALFLLLVSSSVVSAEWSQRVSVSEIITGYKDGFIFFKTTGTIVNPSNCDNAYYSVEQDNADVNSILAVLLAAQKSNSYVKVGVDDNRCGTEGIEHLQGKISVSRIISY